MTTGYSDVVQTARDYYNSADADNFYFHIWGGEDIHIGLYATETDDIKTASRRTVEHLATKLNGIGPEARVLDCGSGYGGAARYLAGKFGCHVTALNLAEKENERARRMNDEAGLSDKIEVVEGSFEELPFNDASFDAVWSQDAILHSGKRAQVIAEIARVLKPGGQFVFTDPMESGRCSAEQLAPVLERIHLDTLGSFDYYEKAAVKAGLKKIAFEDLTDQLIWHYGRVRKELVANRSALKGKVSDDYVTRMIAGLETWVTAGENGCLAWGVMQFAKG